MNEQLAAIKARRAAITPGVWWVERHSGILYEGTPSTCAVLTSDEYDMASFGDDEQAIFDAEFCAAAPADVDALLAMVDALTGERDAWRNRCNASDEEMNDVLHQMQAVTAERDALAAQLAQAQQYATWVEQVADRNDFRGWPFLSFEEWLASSEAKREALSLYCPS